MNLLDHTGYAGALVGLLSAAEWPSHAMLPVTFDENERNLVTRLKVLAAFAETKTQEARRLARELRRVRNEVRMQLEIARVLESSNAANKLATSIVEGSIAVDFSSDLPSNFGIALATTPVRELLSVPQSALLDIDSERLVGASSTSVPVTA